MTASSHGRSYGPRKLPGDPDYIDPSESPEDFGRRIAREGVEEFYAPVFDELAKLLKKHGAELKS